MKGETLYRKSGLADLPLSAAGEWGRRVRAALVLRGHHIDDLARELNISRRTLDRMIVGQRAPSDWETARIEELLDLPMWFIPYGLERPASQQAEGIPAVKVLAALERIETLISEVSELPTQRSDAQVRSYSPNQVAEMLGVHVKTVRRWITDGELKAFKIGNKLLIDKSELGALKTRNAL